MDNMEEVNLTVNLNSCNEEKPGMYTEDNKALTSNSGLSSQKEINTPASGKPFICTLCNKTFSKSS